MGANATTFVPAYVSGEVLTAADLSVTNSGIPVFADSTARDAAFGGTGEKVLAEGQYAYLESTNATQVYDGAAWQSVGVTPGLVCVKAETAFTTVGDFFADGVFTSAYTNYRMILRYFTSAGGDPVMQFRAATVDTATNYNFERLTASSTSVSSSASTSQTAAQIGQDSNGTFYCLSTVEISGVQLAEPTTYQSTNTRNSGAYSAVVLEQYIGNQSASTAFDGIKVLVATGTFTGTYAIYGYSKTV
jgi:hypothetical protein